MDESQSDSQPEVPPLEIPMLHKTRAYWYCCIICISTVYSGFTLTLISASSLPMLVQYYRISLPKQAVLSLLNGILPLGGMLGCLLVPFFSRLASRRQSHHWLMAGTLVQCCVSVAPLLETLVLSRFFLGILNAIYTSVASGYIKQLFPPRMRKKCGAIYSCGRILGILLCYSIAEVSRYSEDETEHVIVFFGPAMLAVLQSGLVVWFMPESFTELVREGQRREKFEAALGLLYGSEMVVVRAAQIREEVAALERETMNPGELRVNKRKKWSSLHLALLRQFCGATYIVVYAGQVMRELGSHLADRTPVIINAIQLAAGLLGIFLVGRCHRRSMLIVSTFLLCGINVMVGVADWMEQPGLLLVAMGGFMVPCGAGLTSIVWSYPSELANSQQGKYASLVSWTGSALVTILPPYIVREVPGDNAYPIFFFFAGYLVVAEVLNLTVVVEYTVRDARPQEMKLRRSILD